MSKKTIPLLFQTKNPSKQINKCLTILKGFIMFQMKDTYRICVVHQDKKWKYCTCINEKCCNPKGELSNFDSALNCAVSELKYLFEADHVFEGLYERAKNGTVQ